MELLYSPAVIAAIDSLSSKDKATIVHSVNEIAHHERDSFGQIPKIKKLKGQSNYYSVRASVDLRIIVQLTDDGLVVMDVVRYSTIDNLFKGSVRNNNEIA